MTESYDVVIAGGGLAGLCLARQLRIEQPERTVAVVEKVPRPLPDATHKIGEATVEVASRYFEHTLKLRDYLKERHLIKNGLRLFPGGGTLPLEDRTEIGPPQMPVVPSFQLDRGRLETDLRAFCEEDGATLIEGASVASLELGAPHRVTLTDGRVLEGRWLVDATGRRRMLARQLGLGQPTGHVGHSAWFRLRGRLDVDHLVPASDEAWHARDPDHIRWLSTSHLMGEGYWVWMIPLATGFTSVGVVVHGEVHDFGTINTRERFLAWLEEHEPVLRAKVDDFEIADFRCIKDYAYTAEHVYSADRWALAGEAGLFVDPFYSPGSDFVALANVYAAELIRRDFAGEDIGEHVEFVDWFYRRLARISTETYRRAAKAFGLPRVMSAKIYWDNFNYWSFVSQYFFQELYRLPLDEQKSFVDVAQRFASLNLRAQDLFAKWSERAKDVPERRHVVFPPIPSVTANLHIDLETSMTPDETRAYMEEKAALAEELLTELLLRAVTELGPDEGEALVDELGAREWPLAGLEARLRAETGGRRGRRKRLSKLARDVERTIGAPVPHEAHASLQQSVTRVLGDRAPAPAPAE